MQIAIIGAGPAGCSTSLFLSKNKIPHVIFDKAVFPRDKVCGDGLAPKTIHILRKWNPEIISKMQLDNTRFADGWGGVVVAPNGKRLEIPIKKKGQDAYPPGFVSKRWDFDHFLTQQLDPTYADFRQGAEIVAVEKEGKGAWLHVKSEGEVQKLWFDMIVAADGDRSMVKKTLLPSTINGEHYGAGIRAYYNGVKALHPDNYIEFFFLDAVIPGYIWVFPLPDGRANVGACMISSYVSANKINLRETFLQAIATHPTLKERFSEATLEGKIVGWGLPLGSKLGDLSSDNLIYTGDAASLIDPISGEGIGNALFSGWLAAEAIVMAHAQQDFSAAFFKKNYDERLHRCIGSDLKMSYFFQKLFRYPKLINFIINKAQRNKVFMETMSCIFDDLEIRKRLYNPLFYVRLIVGFFW